MQGGGDAPPDGNLQKHVLDVTQSGSGDNSEFRQLGSSIFYSDKLAGNKNPAVTTYTGVGSFTVGSKMAQITGGKLGNTNNIIKCGIKFTTTGPATLTAYCQSASSTNNGQITHYESTPDLWVADANNKGSQAKNATLKIEGETKTLGTDKLKKSDTNTIEQVVIEISEAGTYYFGDAAVGKINIYYLDVEF